MSRITLFLIVLVIYMVGMFLIGLRGRKYASTNRDVMTAAGQGTMIMVVGTYMGAHLGNGIVVGGAQYGASIGLGGFWYGAGAALSYVLFALVMVKVSYRRKYITLSDILQDAYGDKLSMAMMAGLSALGRISVCAGQIMAGKLLFEYLGLNGTIGALLTITIVIIYSSMSGMWGVMMTDAIQTTVIIVASVAGALWLFSSGGWNIITTNITEASRWNFQPFEFETLVMMCGPAALNGLVSAPGFQRASAGKTEKIAFVAPFIAALLIVAYAILPVLFGMYGYALDPSVAPKTVLFKVLLEDFPPALGAIMVCAIAAAVMSTCDGTMLSASANVVNDIYLKIINPGCTDEKKLARMTTVATICVGVIATFIALSFDMLIPLLSSAYSLVNAGAISVCVGGLFWKWANKAGAYAGFVAGVGTFTLIKMGIISPPAAAVFPVLPSIIAFVIFSLAFKNKYGVNKSAVFQ